MHYILYIPGLGDHRIKGQTTIVDKWKLFGVKPLVMQMNWVDSESFEHKQQRILRKIDELHLAGHRISIVGVSAGGSAALNVFAARRGKIHKVALVCGVAQPTSNISPSIKSHNPSFGESMNMLQESLNKLSDSDRRQIRSYYSNADITVRGKDSKVVGAQHKLLPPLNHFLAIVYAITFGSRGIISWLKK